MKRAVPGQPAARQREPSDENLLDGQLCIQSIAHVAADIGPEHTILLSQVVNHILVLAIDPDRQNGVGPAHVPNQLTYFGSDAWPSRSTPSALPSPISSEPTTVPTDDRLRFHDDEDALPVSPDSAQQHPKLAVDIREPRPFHRTAEDGELLPKSDILESQLATSLEGRDERANKRRNHAAIKFGARG